ncbi:hypothetical protein C4A39_04379 [Escherichia coli]|nr:hypothetical protein C4A39_04379 [Escherichia coli]
MLAAISQADNIITASAHPLSGQTRLASKKASTVNNSTSG